MHQNIYLYCFKMMDFFSHIKFLLLLLPVFISCNNKNIHVFEIQEITLIASGNYKNPYTEVKCWVDLQGPDFEKRIYGFWDGEQTFKVRVTATCPGNWEWISGSNTEDDNGLNGQAGSFNVESWSEQEKAENPNRRGFIHPTSSRHALQYADGTPFFFIGDTWWAASTWRYPLTGVAPEDNWNPRPQNHSFENMLRYRQKQGYNSVGLIACFPNWNADAYLPRHIDENNIGIRQAWEKFGSSTAKDMHDENGNLPFRLTGKGPLADFDRINPSYFQSLDKKMDYLNSIGFVPFLETVRRDHGPPWKAYFDWPGSFTRYIQYIVSRYGSYNMIFSPLHLDWIPPVFSLSGEEFSEALNSWYLEYGPLPYGQPVTSLINPATHIIYGTGDEVPWLTMHSVGNNPRNHGFYPLLEEQFNIVPSSPTANLEPYYPGWGQAPNKVAGEMAERNSDRDNYFGRAQAWGSVLSGALSGHMYGTGAYDGTTVGEPEGERPLIWEALQYPAGKQIGFLRKFIESEGAEYQDILLASNHLHPQKSEGSHPNGLDGWAFMMRALDKKLALLYFEDKCEIPSASGFIPEKEYLLHWFDPVSGEWIINPVETISDESGHILLDAFPDGNKLSSRDWSLKIKIK